MVIIFIIIENKIFQNSVRTTWEEPTTCQFNDSQCPDMDSQLP